MRRVMDVCFILCGGSLDQATSDGFWGFVFASADPRSF